MGLIEDSTISLYRQATREHCSMRLLCKNYLTYPQKVIHFTAPVGFGTTKRLGFPLLVGIFLKPRVQLFFLTKERYCSSSRMIREWVKVGRVLCWMVPREGNRVLMLRIKDLRVGQWKEPCIGLTQENSIENSVQDCLPYI